MAIEIGQIEAIYRYPVKSMRGDSFAEATVGWSGIPGDRRFAFRRVEEHGEFPWLTGSKLPEMVLFTPFHEGGDRDALPTHVRMPEGEVFPIASEALASEIGRRYGAPVELMHFKHGIFDEAAISVITTDTVREIGRLANKELDIRRFRPNIVVRSTRAVPFEEFDWLGGTLAFGDDGPAVSVMMRDLRCVMINFDPDGGPHSPEIMKALVRATRNYAGIYGTVTRTGRLAVGQTVVLHPAATDVRA